MNLMTTQNKLISRVVYCFALLISGTFSSALSADYGKYGFPQARSAQNLYSAGGVINDWSEDGIWMLNGRWRLSCWRTCATANSHNISFDMAHAMVMTGGAASHAHQYRNFKASSVEVDGDNLTIMGVITGSGPIGTANIVIKLNNIAEGAGTFFFQLPSNEHVVGEIGGVIMRSHSRRSRKH